jgi:predicted nucleotidyltransferase
MRIVENYVRILDRKINVRKAILTGSRATGSCLEDSDVDLIIVSDDLSKMQLPDRLRYLQKQWKSKIPLEAFGYTADEFATLRRKSTYVKEAVRTGIVLVPGRTSADQAGSGKKSVHVSEMKSMLDRMRAEDDHQNIDELVGLY